MDFSETTACLLRKQEPQCPQKSSKTLPRRSCVMNKDIDEFPSTLTEKITGTHNKDAVIPPLQNAPRPTTLPTRGAASRARKAELGVLKDLTMNERKDNASGSDDINSNTMSNSHRVNDNISPCESPSYVTNISSYKFPESNNTQIANETDSKSLPAVPSKEGKKHIQANAKRHVRKYPLIIPANGVQRTLNKVMGEEDKQTILKSSTLIAANVSGAVPTIKPFTINNNRLAANVAEYENCTTSTFTSSSISKSQTQNSNDRAYQNIGSDDTASLQFESIMEADINKDQVLQSPDVTDGFYNFSIQKDHYHKSKEVDYDAQKLAGGLYVNDDELRNLDIDKNMAKINKQNCENKKSNESLDAKSIATAQTVTPPLTTEEKPKLELANSNAIAVKSVEIIDNKLPQPVANATVAHCSPEKLLKSNTPLSSKADNELAGNALFKKVRESVDKAMVKPSTSESLTCNQAPAEKPLTEAELFSAAVNRLNDSNSVSCEDLLEFSDKKPKGHERGVDSDEVRIMMKVLGKDSSPERCLTTLEFIEWDVHKAIKIIKLQNILKDIDLNLPETVEYLLKYDWDLHTTARRLKTLKT